MTPNNNLSPLPFYTSVGEQNHNKEYAFGRAYPLLCKTNRLLPFFIVRDTRSASTFSVKLLNVEGDEMYDLSTQMSSTMGVTAYDDYDVIWYNAKLAMSGDMQEGYYYMKVSDGVETWYSDIFRAMGDISRLLCLAWWDDDPLYFEGGCIPYSKSTYMNRIYLDTQIGKPEYNFEEEGEERDGYFFPTSQLSEKVYKFNFVAPEYLCDALRVVRMSDHIVVTSGGKTYNVDTLQPTIDWQDQGDLASVTCEFETDTIVKKIAKAVNENDDADYNEDFNEDYYI